MISPLTTTPQISSLIFSSSDFHFFSSILERSMKIQCDVCSGDEASVFCCADEAALCHACDRKVHHANKLAGKHRRFSLSSSEKTQPLCDICKERRGFVFCQEDRAILCRDCDDPIHSANDLTMKHNRFLLAGARLSQDVLEFGNNCDSNRSKATQESSFRNKPATVEDSSVISNGSSSISEYLMKTLPGYRVEDLLVNDADELYKKDEMMPFLESDLGSAGDEFPIWVPQVPQIPSLNFVQNGVNGVIHYNYSFGVEKPKQQNQQYHGLKGVSKDQWSDHDSFMVPQISTSPVSSSNKRPRTCAAAWDF